MGDRLGEISGRKGSKELRPATEWPDSQIEALVSLLADDDERILSMVRENLARVGERALPALRKISEDPDPRLRLRARQVARQIEVASLRRAFWELGSRPDGAFDLEDAAVLVARIEYPDLDADEIDLQLEELADGLRPLIPRSEVSGREKVEILSEYLFDELGFTGNTRDYYDPDNTYINKVIERRLGIPVSLSVVTILVGRRVGMPLYGVGLPKHFLVKYQDAREEVFFDPFNGGQILTRKDCTQLLSNEGYFVREGFVSEYLAISSARDITIRMLRNLLLIYSRLRSRTRVRHLTEYVELLRTRGAKR